MMIYRSLVVGLLAAVALLVAEHGASLERIAQHVPTAAPAVDDAGWEPERGSVVHISRRGAGADPTAALGIGPADRVVAIDEGVAGDWWRAALRDRWQKADEGTYFELRVEGPAGPRRLLVLVAP